MIVKITKYKQLSLNNLIFRNFSETLDKHQTRSLNYRANFKDHAIDVRNSNVGPDMAKHLTLRNCLSQSSCRIDELDLNRNHKLYIGFDPTARLLHLGNYIGILTAMRCASFGVNPVFVIGGATGLIGDPSGKSKDRNKISNSELQYNISSIQKQIKYLANKIISSHDYQKYTNSLNITKAENIEFKIVNNAQFYENMNIFDFMENIANNFRMGPLLSRENVKNRVNSPSGLSLTEFLYQTFQAYDFMKLNELYNVKLQLGGSDQWGNMLSGLELVKRIKDKTVYNITFPLVTTQSGQKFGKSEGNALFLSYEDNSSLVDGFSTKLANKIFQYIINLPDACINDLLYKFTFLSKDEIDEVISIHNVNPNERISQKRLAVEMIKLLFSKSDLDSCLACYESFYSCRANGEINDEFLKLSTKTKLNFDILSTSLPISKLCIDQGILPTKSQFRRLVQNGNVFLNNLKLNEDKILSEADLIQGQYFLLQTAKNKKFVFQLENDFIKTQHFA